MSARIDMHRRMETREQLADFAEFVLYALETESLHNKLEAIKSIAFKSGLANRNEYGRFRRLDQ